MIKIFTVYLLILLFMIHCQIWFMALHFESDCRHASSPYRTEGRHEHELCLVGRFNPVSGPCFTPNSKSFFDSPSGRCLCTFAPLSSPEVKSLFHIRLPPYHARNSLCKNSQANQLSRKKCSNICRWQKPKTILLTFLWIDDRKTQSCSWASAECPDHTVRAFKLGESLFGNGVDGSSAFEIGKVNTLLKVIASAGWFFFFV